MKNKIAITILIAFGLFLSISNVSAITSILDYSRSPSGTEITSPVEVYVEVDNWNACVEATTPAVFNYWNIAIDSDNAPASAWHTITGFDSGTLSGVKFIDIPVGEEVTFVGIICATVPPSDDYYDWTDLELEYDFENTIFTIVEPPFTGSIMPITDISSLLATIGQLFTDLKLFIMLAIGLPVGFWVINRSIDLVTDKTKK